jgi:GH24 family phage-related lysozyme (muramidase)
VATYLEQSLTKLKEFEGCVPWMYRDTVGKVTVGVGLMLPNAAAAQTLPFARGTHIATAEEIALEYARVDAMPAGRTAAFYKSQRPLELSQQEIDSKLTAVLQGFEVDLRAQLPHYESLPDSIKMALLDMVYNLGPVGLFKGFPHLVTAIQTGDWQQAAEHCTRRGPSAARNEWTREQFLSAVVGAIKAEAEGWVTRIGRQIRQTLSSLIGQSR